MKQAHLSLDPLSIPYALLPGDPGRLDLVKNFLEDAEELAYNREFRSICGKYQGVNVLAVSTGIGGPSCAICVEELKHIGVKYAVRIGSAGALQKSLNLGDLILVEGAVRHEGTSKAYVEAVYPAVPDMEFLHQILTCAKKLHYPYQLGLALSHDAFYMDTEEKESAYWSSQGILGADMETSTLYTIGRLRGIKTASILNNVVLYGQSTEESIADYQEGSILAKKGEERQIHLALESFLAIEKARKE